MKMPREIFRNAIEPASTQSYHQGPISALKTAASHLLSKQTLHSLRQLSDVSCRLIISFPNRARHQHARLLGAGLPRLRRSVSNKDREVSKEHSGRK
jgi:hypothetical protein